ALAGGPRGQHQDTTAPSKVDESEVRGELPHRLCDPAARGGAQGSHQISLGAGCGELPEYTGVCDGSNLIGVVDPRDVVAAVQGDGNTDYETDGGAEQPVHAKVQADEVLRDARRVDRRCVDAGLVVPVGRRDTWDRASELIGDGVGDHSGTSGICVSDPDLDDQGVQRNLDLHGLGQLACRDLELQFIDDGVEDLRRDGEER